MERRLKEESERRKYSQGNGRDEKSEIRQTEK